MAPRLSGQTSIFGVVFFVPKSPLGIERQKKPEKKCIFHPKASEPCFNIDISYVAYYSLLAEALSWYSLTEEKRPLPWIEKDYMEHAPA